MLKCIILCTEGPFEFPARISTADSSAVKVYHAFHLFGAIIGCNVVMNFVFPLISSFLTSNYYKHISRCR